MTKKVEVRGGKQWRSKIHALDKSYNRANFAYEQIENFDCPAVPDDIFYGWFLACYIVQQNAMRIAHRIAFDMELVRTFNSQLHSPQMLPIHR